MSLKINEINGCGTGTLGDLNNIGLQINSYARVTALTPSALTINLSAQSQGSYEQFAAGTEILFHVSATTSSTYKDYLGCWAVCKITAVNDNVLTVDKDLTTILPSEEFGRYYVQIVTIAQIKNLTIGVGNELRPPAYSTTQYYGGIVALKCSETLTFDGGNINLVDCGIPVANKTLRPILAMETSGTMDVDKYAGWENFQTKERLLLNSGDGLAFIVAKNISCHENSRIGNVSSYGSQYCRGATDSVGNKPSNVTNIGGSTIFIAAETIDNFTPKIISKYRTSTSTAGQGLCRCFIASNTKLPVDEGLYAYESLSNPAAVMNNFNVRDFGNGSAGDLNAATMQLNNYARVTAISADRKKLTYTGKTTAGLAQITANALVMIHQTHKSTTLEHTGRFFLGKILSDNGSEITLNVALPNEFDADNYSVQVVSVLQANNFTLNAVNKDTPKYNGTTGGILALAVKNTCDISGGQLNVETKGGGIAYGAEGLKFIGNAQMSDRLPIGQGHGSVFLLAKTLTVNSSTRIGATYSGSTIGSYKGADGNGKGNNGTGGSPAGGGTQTNKYNGGYGSNSSNGACQGAHILIIADTVNNFSEEILSTGGKGGVEGEKLGAKGSNGGCGYGGGGADTHTGASGSAVGGKGGFIGGGGGSKCTSCTKSWGEGGGSSGFAFIFANNNF